MKYSRNKTQIKRILTIVKRLYMHDKLQISQLAKEFNVSTRTIHRDMQKISEAIPLEHYFGKWWLDQKRLDKDIVFQQELLLSFAHNANIDNLCIEKSNATTDDISFAIEYGRLPKKMGEDIFKAIKSETVCIFAYIKPDGSSVREVDPIKIFTENSRWYLIARDHKDNKLKHFNLQNIRQLTNTDTPIDITPEIRKKADAMVSTWSSPDNEPVAIRLYIEPSIASYIEDIKLHKSQTIEEKHYDGSMITNYTITHKMEILPQIKSWIPNVFIIEPAWLREEIIEDAKKYLDQNRDFDTYVS